MLLINKPCIA